MPEAMYSKKRVQAPERVRVRIEGGRAYDIIIGSGIWNNIGEVLRDCSLGGEYYLLSDQSVYRLYGRRIEKRFQDSGYTIIGKSLIPPGEENKSLENWRHVLDCLVGVEDGMQRRLFIVALGGGVVGDLGGFVAATYRRGVPYVQIPTTLMSQVDSSVGGKTAVNHPGGKNLIGSFHQPAAVLIDLECLRTLPKREIRSGLVEVIKYGLIRDRRFFLYLEKNLTRILRLDKDVVKQVVKRSCQLKARIVGEDEKEQKGIRTILNLGHTVGHALEAATGFGRYSHGEAVGLGILCAARISLLLNRFSEEGYRRIRRLFTRAGLTVVIEGVRLDTLWEAMKHDKKFIHGKNRFVLPIRMGQVEVVEDIDPATIRKAIQGLMT